MFRPEVIGVRIVVQSSVAVLGNTPLTTEACIVHLQLRFAVFKIEQKPPVALRIVDPVIDSHTETVFPVLHVSAFRIVIKQFDFPVGLKVPIRVLSVPQVRGFGDQHTTLHQCNGPGHHQIVHEHRSILVIPVAVAVLQNGNFTDRLIFAGSVDVVHVPTHLDDPHAPGRIPANHHRIHDMRFGSSQLNGIPRGRSKGFMLFLRFKGGRRRNVPVFFPVIVIFGTHRTNGGQHQKYDDGGLD